MPQSPIAVADFKAWFTRDFAYGATADKVLDADIAKALVQAAMTFNESLWADETEKTTAFLYLAAHFLVIDLQAAGGLSLVAGGGVSSPGSPGPMTSKSVGSVSASYTVPSDLVNDPILGPYTRTGHGMKYLQLVKPRLGAQAMLIPGWGVNEF